MNLPVDTAWPDATRINTVITIDDSIDVYNDEAKHHRIWTVEEKVIESCKIAFEKGCFSTLPVLDNLVDIYISQGRGLDAVRLGHKVFEMCLSSLGEGHHHTLTAMEGLVATYGILGRSSEQRGLKKRILKNRAKWLGEDHQDTINTRNQLMGMDLDSTDMLQVEMRWKRLISHFGINLAVGRGDSSSTGPCRLNETMSRATT